MFTFHILLSLSFFDTLRSFEGGLFAVQSVAIYDEMQAETWQKMLLKSYFSNLCNNFEVKWPCWIFSLCFRWWLEWWSLPLPSPLGFTSNSNKCSQYLKNIPQLLQKIAYAVVNFFLTLKAVQGQRCPEKRKREHFHFQSLPVQPVCSICQAIGIFSEISFTHLWKS